VIGRYGAGFHLTEKISSSASFTPRSPKLNRTAKQLVRVHYRVIATDEALSASPKGSDAWNVTRKSWLVKLGSRRCLCQDQ